MLHKKKRIRNMPLSVRVIDALTISSWQASCNRSGMVMLQGAALERLMYS